MSNEDKVSALFNSMDRNLNREYPYLDAITQEHIKIAKKGMFDQFKIWFREDLQELGLNASIFPNEKV